jgi:hypothetical protein
MLQRPSDTRSGDALKLFTPHCQKTIGWLARAGVLSEASRDWLRRRPTFSGVARPALLRDFKTSPEVIGVAVMLYVRFPLSLRNVEDLLHECGNDITHETVRVWRGRFGQHFDAEIRRSRLDAM